MNIHVEARSTAPFTVFYRASSSDGGFVCRRCNVYRNDIFARLGDLCAIAAQHLNICRAEARYRPIEGTAIINGVMHAAILRDGVLVITVAVVFRPAPPRLRLVV